jgi:hypothetical protein
MVREVETTGGDSLGGLPLVLTLGAIAGCIGSLAILMDPWQNWLSTGTIYFVFSFGPALLASRYSAGWLLVLWLALAFGTAAGVYLSVVVHPMAGRGERNLWPFEIAIFLGVGLVPSWGGLFFGRYLRLRKLQL